MRQKTRQAVADDLQSAVGAALAPHEANIAHMRDQLIDVQAAVAAVKPVNMDLTQELADDIVTKLHGPLTISNEVSAWLRKIAAYTSVLVTSPFGYGPEGGTLWIEIKPNGTFYLQIKDQFGSQMWQGTFVPPDFGKDRNGDDG